MRLLLLILLACTAFPGHAGKLFACRDARGQVAFVDRGCPSAGERREVALTETTKPSKAAADADAKQIAAWEQASRARLPASLGGSARPSAPPRAARGRRPGGERDDACTTAKAVRAKAERERSFELSFDERRRLSDAVWSACGLR